MNRQRHTAPTRAFAWGLTQNPAHTTCWRAKTPSGFPCFCNESTTNLQAAAAATPDGISVLPNARYNHCDSVLVSRGRSAAPAAAAQPSPAQKKPGGLSAPRSRVYPSSASKNAKAGQARLSCAIRRIAFRHFMAVRGARKNKMHTAIHSLSGGEERRVVRGAIVILRMRADPPHRGSSVEPIRNLSTACAAWRPSRIAHTTSDWPRRMSPAVKTLASELL
jgi:hypothetical protein